ncbi:MAG: PilN domain-containing protein [Aquabacterium sp.]|nr:PilN domain-containing protein [Aquabacterium sp.]
MILINLLPHREERRKQRKRAFFVGLGVAAGCGLLVAGLWYGALQQMTQAQQARNNFLRDEIAKLETQIKDIATLRGEIDSLKARQGAVEDLQLNRNVPVHLLDELVRLTPEGIYLAGIKQTDGSVLVNGVAQTNERVSEFLRNAQSNSPWLDRMELLEIKAITQPPVAGSREQRRLFEFALRVSLKQPGAPASAPAGAGSAPRPA